MEQRLEAVVAVAENDVIGRGGRLPWRLPADLRHFKRLTLGKHVLMGRKTFDSIGKPLPNRTNLVLSRSQLIPVPGCCIVRSLAEAQELAAAAGSQASSPLMIIGGAEVYRLAAVALSRLHLTVVHTQIADGDAFFAEWRSSAWRESQRERFEADAENEFPYSFVTLDRAAF